MYVAKYFSKRWMKLKSQLALSYRTTEVVPRLHTASHLEINLCVSYLQLGMSKASSLEWSPDLMPFVVHQAESWKWHLAIQKGHLAPELISGFALGSEGQRLDHWVQIAQFHDPQGISRKHQDHAGSLGIQRCTAALGTLFWPWPSFLPKEHLFQVFWNAQEKIQGSRGWQLFRKSQRILMEIQFYAVLTLLK